MTKKTKKPRKSEIRRFIEYMVSGGAWFWSGYILIVLLDNHIGLFLANLVGNAVGITINFVLQRYWVFDKNKDTSQLGSSARRYVVYTALNAFLLNYLILLGLQNVGIKPEFGQFIASAFFTAWNYFWYKVYVFPEKFTKQTKRVKQGPLKILAHTSHHPRAYRTHQ